MRSGQILILVLLIVVVSLAVGLSVASRNITNLRTSTQTENSQRAYSAAEGGVEDILSRLPNVANVISTGTASGGCTYNGAGTSSATCPVSVGGINSNVIVKANTNLTATVDTSGVAQLNLSGVASSSSITINWGSATDSSEKDSSYNNAPASLELIEVDGVSPYTAIRRYVATANRLEQPIPATISCTGSPYLCSYTFNLGTTPVLLRIKPFWVKTTLNIVCPAGCPTQYYDIQSSAAVPETGVTRKIDVTRAALPQLPSVFDYALYSEGDLTK